MLNIFLKSLHVPTASLALLKQLQQTLNEQYNYLQTPTFSPVFKQNDGELDSEEYGVSTSYIRFSHSPESLHNAQVIVIFESAL